ncbi:MAG: DUF6785 family protein [Armatimonadota bacterium]
MSLTGTPTPEAPAAQSALPAVTRGLTLRSFVITVFAIFLMGMWIEYEECFNVRGGAFAENAPPNSAVTVILILLTISALLYVVHRKLRMVTAELVVVYCALIAAAPLMTQGMWHRFPGLISGAPHEQDFKTYESLPPMLWPHGDNLLENGRFTNGLEGFSYLGQAPKVQWDENVEWKGRTWKCPVLDNGEDAAAKSTLTFTVPRHDAKGNEQLKPGENFLFSLLVKAEGIQKGSIYSVYVQADNSPANNVLLGTGDTKPSLALPNGFERQGVNPFTIPRTLREKLTFTIGIAGAGKLTVHDVQFFNSQAVEGMYNGINIVRERNAHLLAEHERDFTLVKPDNMFSLGGLKYIVRGFIPLRQWGQTAFAWTLLIGALFMGFFGLNVLLRKQWVEHDRLSFPQNILPRELFTEENDAKGRPFLSLFRNRVMWGGLIFGLVMALLRGLHYYNPAVPVPLPGYVDPIVLSTYVTHPLLKVFLQNMTITLWLTFLAIALFVETDILFSMFACYVLFQVLFVLGKAFNFDSVPGYPWQHQQTIGAFLGYAALAIFMGRKHLAQIFRHVLGRTKLNEGEEVVSYRTALIMVAGSLAILIAWGIWTKMGWLASLLFFGLMLTFGFTASKIRAESGPVFSYWFPYFGLYFVAAIGGFALFGTTGMLVATICAGFMGTSNFLYIAPVQVEMMELGRRFRVRMKDVGWGLTLGLIGGLFVGGYILLVWSYGFGTSRMSYDYPVNQYWYLNGNYVTAELNADRAFLGGTLDTLPEGQWWNLKDNINAKGITIGIVVTWTLAFLRGAFTWFPLHPIGYVLSSTYFAGGFWFIIFLAWAIRSIVQRLGGAHSIRRGVIPFAAGMFIGCMISIILFDGASLIMRAQGMTDIYNNTWP